MISTNRICEIRWRVHGVIPAFSELQSELQLLELFLLGPSFGSPDTKFRPAGKTQSNSVISNELPNGREFRSPAPNCRANCRAALCPCGRVTRPHRPPVQSPGHHAGRLIAQSLESVFSHEQASIWESVVTSVRIEDQGGGSQKGCPRDRIGEARFSSVRARQK